MKHVLGELLGGMDVVSHGKAKFQLKRAKVQILEMEDVLFHLNSAVMMPSKPIGKSSKQGSKDAKQEKLSGIRALAVVFRQYEFDPRKKILIAAHTDSSGDDESNFKLSAKRGEDILYLLTGEKEKWAEVCHGQQRVEDYQQICKYFSTRPGWKKCDPGKIDNRYGTNTRKGADNFFKAYRALHEDEKTKKDFPEELPDNLIAQIHADPSKRWPVIAWKAVFDLYDDELRSVLKIDSKELKRMREKRIKKRFVDIDKKYVACGESFPLDKPAKSNYRSQRNRRVEILFFNEKEALKKIDCPPEIKKKHKSSECPLWHDKHMAIEYIDADYLTGDLFHVKFIYFDRIIKDIKEIPEGLTFETYKIGDPKPLQTGLDYSDGVYLIRVLDLKKTDKIYFKFDTKKSPDGKTRQWVYTKDKDSQPEIIEKKDEDIAKLSFKERMNYYDLPVEWRSRNYMTRHEGVNNTGKKFDDIVAQYKPFGGKSTTPAKPFVCSLDDIVLINDKGGQNINNATGTKPQDLKDDDTKLNLTDKSRLTLLYLDEADEYKMKIFKALSSHPYFSDIPFKKNLISTEIPQKNKPRLSRVVVFCSLFYDITGKRTIKDPKFKYEQGHILGARAAIHNDKDVHRLANLSVNLANGSVPAAMKDYVQTQCGNYESHYLHECGFTKANTEDKVKPLSYQIIYWYCRFEAHTSDPAVTSDPPDAPNWRQDWEKNGIINSMNRTNRPYLLERKNGSEDILIRQYHFYEAKLDGVGGKHKCIVRIAKADADWMLPTNAKFCQASYQGQVDYYGGAGTDAKTNDVDGATYAPLANHHEMGHATGLWDDYMYDEVIKKTSSPWTTYHTYFGLPKFNQPYTAPGGPYSLDYISTMAECRNPRMRDFWHFVNWINDETGDATNKILKPFLKKTTFKMTYKYTKDGADQVISLDLWRTAYRDPNKASFEKTNYQYVTGQAGKSDLLLYQLGGGETAQTIDPRHRSNRNQVMNPRIVFNGILVVRHKIGVKVIDAGPLWNEDNISTWIKKWLQKPLIKLNKYYFECSRDDNDFKNILVVLVPHFKIYDAPVPAPSGNWTTAAPGDSTFNVIVTRNGGNSFNGVGRKIEVDNSVDKNKITRYLFGKTSAGAVGKNDLTPIAKWLKSKIMGVLGGSYVIKDLP